MIEDLCEGAMMIDMVEQCFRNEDPMASPRILDRAVGDFGMFGFNSLTPT